MSKVSARGGLVCWGQAQTHASTTHKSSGPPSCAPLQTAELLVTPGRDCVVPMRLSKQTSSGGHKFKVCVRVCGGGGRGGRPGCLGIT